MSEQSLKNLQQSLIDKPSLQNFVFSEVIREVFGDVKQYEQDVPQNFIRPCFLFINPDKSTRTQELTATMYKIIQSYEIYFFAVEDDVETLTSYKDALVDYLMGVKKIVIPGTNHYFTIEQVVADTDDVNSMVAFMIEVSRTRSRNLRRSAVNKIKDVINHVKVEERGEEKRK